MTDLPPIDPADLFDEAGYLRLYPGIAEAMARGIVDTPRQHYIHHGRREGRQPNDVDPAFYLAAYPDVARDLGRPAAAEDAASHYVTLGRVRGYLPNAAAPRLANGAAFASPFGGFWTDLGNVLDLIQGRLDLGRLKQREAALLRQFALDGIVALDRPYDREQFRDAALAIDQAFTGLFPDMLFLPLAPNANPLAWTPELTPWPAAALDPHMMSGKVRDLLFDPHVTAMLSLIFEAPPVLTASRAFLREAAEPDRDVAWFAHTLPLQFAAVTFALEDSGPETISVWPGSHRLPDLPWSGAHPALSEARRGGVPGLDEALAHRPAWVRWLIEGREPRRLTPATGDRMVRHANLVHAAAMPDPPLQRRSLTAWYCPAHVAPCYIEATRARTHAWHGFVFSSGVYPAMDPLD